MLCTCTSAKCVHAPTRGCPAAHLRLDDLHQLVVLVAPIHHLHHLLDVLVGAQFVTGADGYVHGVAQDAASNACYGLGPAQHARTH